MIWQQALPGPRVVPIKQFPLKLIGEEWDRYRAYQDSFKALPFSSGSPNDEQEDDGSGWTYGRGFRWPDIGTENEGHGADADNPSSEENEEADIMEDEEDSESDLDDYVCHMYRELQRFKHYGIKSNVAHPAILFVCHESFAVASRLYSKAFSCGGASIPETWFDYRRDTLFIDHDTFAQCQFRRIKWVQSIIADMDDKYAQLGKVANLALRVRLGNVDVPPETDDSALEQILCETLGFFGGVKSLTLVIEHYEEESYTWPAVGEGEHALTFIEDLIDLNRVFLASALRDGNYNPTMAPRSDYFFIKVDETRLEELRMKWIRDGLRPWEMPTIRRKICLAARVKQRYEDLKHNYHARQIVRHLWK
jgi:hypothetical protein